MSVTTETATFPARFENLARISEFVTQVAVAAGLDERAIYEVELAVDEACSNIIEHAYGGESRGDIDCTCRADQKGLTVILRDQGRAFDPADIPEPDVCAPLQERDAGGLGLYFMFRLMDEVSFEFETGSGNVLTMVKYREDR